MADKALLIGINRFKKISGLRGCVNDVENLRRLLTEHYGFRVSNVKVLTDDRAVKTEVRKQMKWLFKDVGPGDRVILHLSSHGSYTTDLDGDEEDGVDELFCLYDMDFNDPDSYLLDDELKTWTDSAPAGIDLSVILDTCHSGSGTRLLLAPPEGRSQPLPMRVDVSATVAHTIGSEAGMRGLEVADAVDRAMDPANDNLVLVRFVDPPPAIKEAAARRSRPDKRGFVKVDLNHTLLAGCRSDQTSADAVIEGTPNGAFTYHLCKTLRDNGTEIPRREVINRVEHALRAGRFSQVPQLEAARDDVPLFGTPRASQSTTGSDASSAEATKPGAAPPDAPQPSEGTQPESSPGFTFEQYATLLEKISLLSPEAQLSALAVLKSGPVSSPARGARAAGSRHLVYVHGICEHLPAYSDPWWQSLRPHTSVFGEGTLNETRHEVLWSNLVNQRAIQARSLQESDARAVREMAEEAALEAEIRELMADRADRHAMDAAAEGDANEAERSLAMERGLLDPFRCIDDFTVYMVNSRIRAQVIQRFTDVMRRLLNGPGDIDIIAHSWGTVVAYEGLRELASLGAIARRVRNFFTVGAALSMGPVKMRLRPENRDGARPAVVARWVNIAAKGDIIGGPLKGRPYEVDEDFPAVEAFGCRGFFKARCAHESYFRTGNVAVNREIFARFIN